MCVYKYYHSREQIYFSPRKTNAKVFCYRKVQFSTITKQTEILLLQGLHESMEKNVYLHLAKAHLLASAMTL